MLKIHSLETFGTHEGPGIRFVVFLQGCNYRCLYCHNPDTQPLSVNIKINDYSIDELVTMIQKNRVYYGKKGGVTVSGGEPLLQAGELVELFKKLKLKPHLASPSKGEGLEQSIHTALDTNGSILNDDVKELLKYTDLVLLDIKHIDPVWHEKVTQTVIARSRSDEAIYNARLPRLDSRDKSMARNDTSPCVPSIKFANYLESQNIPFWIRYVLVPGYTDQPEYLEETAKALSKYKNLERIEILPYHTLGVKKYEELNMEYKLKNVEPPTEAELAKAKKIFEKSGKMVIIR